MEFKGGGLTTNDNWSEVTEYLSWTPRETSAEPDWPMEFRARILWSLARLRDQRLIEENHFRGTNTKDEVGWEVTDEGRKVLKRLELI